MHRDATSANSYSLQFYAKLRSFKLAFYIADSVPMSSNTDHLPTACYVWSVKVNYMDENESHLRVWVSAEVTGRCDDMDNKEEVRSLPASIMFSPPLATKSNSPPQPGSLNFILHTIALSLSTILMLVLLFELIGSIRDAVLCKKVVESDETLFNRLPFMLQRTIRRNGGDLRNLGWRFYMQFIQIWDVSLMFACGFVVLSCWGHMLGDDLFTSDVDFFFTGERSRSGKSAARSEARIYAAAQASPKLSI